VNVSKAALEGAFVDELALLQPTPGYMRLVKDRILHVWEQQLFFPEGIAFDGNRFNRTAVTAPLFNYFISLNTVVEVPVPLNMIAEPLVFAWSVELVITLLDTLG
jgi:hypothetical protein